MSTAPIVVNSPFDDISLEEEDFEGTGIEEGNRSGAARSELKRQREKNRRKAIANAYGELATFIVQVDPALGDEDLQMNRKRRKSDDGDKTSGLSQVNVVGRALKLMKRLHSENEENKRILKALQDRGVQDFNSEKVLVIVPTLNPVSNDAGFPPHSGPYPSYSNSSPSYGQGTPHHIPDYAMVPMRNQRQPYHPQTSNFSSQGYGGGAGLLHTSSTTSQQLYPQGVQYR